MANIKKSWQNVRVGMSEFDNKVILLEFFDWHALLGWSPKQFVQRHWNFGYWILILLPIMGCSWGICCLSWTLKAYIPDCLMPSSGTFWYCHNQFFDNLENLYTKKGHIFNQCFFGDSVATALNLYCSGSIMLCLIYWSHITTILISRIFLARGPDLVHGSYIQWCWGEYNPVWMIYTWIQNFGDAYTCIHWWLSWTWKWSQEHPCTRFGFIKVGEGGKS
jgi:hypothetical protein